MLEVASRATHKLITDESKLEKANAVQLATVSGIMAQRASKLLSQGTPHVAIQVLQSVGLWKDEDRENLTTS